MKKLTFKTNINCGGCIEKVTPYLTQAKSISAWDVDTSSKDKKLTVTGVFPDKMEVISLVQEAGFDIQEKKRLLSF